MYHKSMFCKSWMLMTLDKSSTKSMSLNTSMEMSVFGHQSKGRTTRCICLAARSWLEESVTRQLIWERLKVVWLSDYFNQIKYGHWPKECNSHYEFTLIPRALFAPDESMLRCTDKSKLIHNLVKLSNANETNEKTETPTVDKQDDDDDRDAPVTSLTYPRIVVVDWIVLDQKMTIKKRTLGAVKYLTQSLNDRLTSLTARFSEVILVFDTYKPAWLTEKQNSREMTTTKSWYAVQDFKRYKHQPHSTHMVSITWKNISRPDKLTYMYQSNPHSQKSTQHS